MRSIHSSLQEARDCLLKFLADENALQQVEIFARRLAEAFRNGNKVLSCGNGGSMSDAMHFAEEFSGRYRKERPPLPALALSDPSHMSCVANDYGFEEVFARQVQALGQAGDMLFLLSTSGNSPNLLRAADVARTKNMFVVALLGRGGGSLRERCDLSIIVPGDTSDRIQELHIKIIHVVIEAVERMLFEHLYSSESPSKV